MDSASLDTELTAQASSLRRLARDLLGDPHLAEDAVQDALQSALERPPRARGALSAWLRTVVARCALDLRRGERRRRRREQAVAATPPVHEVATTDEHVELQRRVLTAVQSLAEPYRTTIWLRYYEDHPPTAIAVLRGEPVKTVKTRLRRALQQLRQQLDAASGSRAAWTGLLVPFAAPASPVLGAALMSAPARFGIVATVLVALSASLWWLSTAAAPALMTPPAPGGLVASEVRGDAGRAGLAATASADNERIAAVPSGDPATGIEIGPSSRPSLLLAFGGVVLDLDGLPLPGVAITWNGTPFAPPVVADAEGRFRGLRPASMGTLGVEPASLVPVLEPVLFDGELVHADLTIVVAPCVRIAGVVVDTAGQPIASAQITASLDLPLRARIARVLDRCVDATFETMTPDDGTFCLARAPLAAAARLGIRARGHRAIEVPVAEACLRSHFVLERVVAGDVLEGVVVDADGAAVRSAVVMLHDHSVVTEPDGSFRLDLWRVGDLPAGILPELTAASPNRLPGRVVCLAPDWRTRGAWPAVLRVQLGGVTATIRGRVLHNDGTPFAEPWVTFAPPEPEQVRPTMFDAHAFSAAVRTAAGLAVEPGPDAGNGEFETARVVPGRHRLRVFHHVSLEVFVTEPIATGPVAVEIRLPDGGLWPPLRGRVVDRRGQPVPGADWILERDDPTPGATTPITSAWHQATAEGVVEYPPVSRFVRTLCVKAAGMAEWVRVELDSLPDATDFRVVVPVGCQARIEVGASWGGVDTAHLENATGSRSAVVFTNGNIAIGTPVISLTEGRSQTFVALDDCVELVLSRGGVEVGRVPVVLRPGEMNVLRL